MNRERALKVVLVLVGLLFLAGVYPIVMYLWRPGNESPGDAMMLSLYVTLGVFLLLAARNPSANRSLIAFTAWSSFAHGAVMAVLAFQIASERRDLLIAVAVLAFIESKHSHCDQQISAFTRNLECQDRHHRAMSKARPGCEGDQAAIGRRITRG